VDVFQTNPMCRVAVLSITAAGVGLTLTAASNVFFAELFYNPGALMQAEDRAHRIGQQDTVNVQYLVARNTIDEQLFRILNNKISVLGETLDGVCGRKFDVGGEAKVKLLVGLNAFLW
jgi:SWI/SNF-related matrix-associated actin-dependent regulator 1 of chromatin subfamily A